jgi:twitching motility protein PilT
MAALIEHINATRPVSIVTIEDPIEVLFPDKMAVVNQRELGVDTTDYATAVRRAMRQDADVIMLSEIADLEAAAAAIAAAETGHLVLAVMHTGDPVETIKRLVGLFPKDSQPTVRVQIATLLRGIISQRLVESADGTGMVLATEVLTNHGKVQEKLLAGEPVEGLLELMKESEFFGMRTFDQSLLELVKQRRVAVATALSHVRNTHEFRARALEAGIEA